MIDISLLREQPDALKASLVRRGLDLDVDLMAQIDRDRRSTRAKAESMRAEQKSLGRSIPRLESEARQHAIAEAGKLASSYRAALAEADELDEQFRMLWSKGP
ncbi:MAG: serine--tRNA ligase, partial [bacterium]|nr:serine--tRNA ligase [bacterium]